MNTSAPALKLALCLTAAAGLHLSLLTAFTLGETTPQVRGGATRVLLGTQAAALGQENAPADQPTEDKNPDDPETSAEPEPPSPKPAPIKPEPVPSPKPQKAPAPPEPAPEQAPPSEKKLAAAEPKPSTATPLERKGQAQTDAAAGEQKQPMTEPAPRETGEPASKASADTDAPTATADKPGNSASSNYKGLVMAHISRIPRPRASSPGSAYVSFTISSSGNVEQIGISKSSGSSRFDREAMKLVKQAAPFPSPPAGVNTTFEIRIEGR